MATHERLIRAGLDLFHRHGIHPVGLDRILQQAGVTKTTFYNYFESKEDFACAVIDRFGEEVHTRIQLRVDSPHSQDIKQHLLEIFDAWDQLFDHESFRGCMLVGAGVSSGDQHDPARQVAIKNKQRLLHLYEELAAEAGIKKSSAVCHAVWFARRWILNRTASIRRPKRGERSKRNGQTVDRRRDRRLLTLTKNYLSAEDFDSGAPSTNLSAAEFIQ